MANNGKKGNVGTISEVIQPFREEIEPPYGFFPDEVDDEPGSVTGVLLQRQFRAQAVGAGARLGAEPRREIGSLALRKGPIRRDYE